MQIFGVTAGFRRRQLAEGTARPPRLAAWTAAQLGELATFTPQSSHSRVAWARAASAFVRLGFGRIVALHHRPSALYQINAENRYLFF